MKRNDEDDHRQPPKPERITVSKDGYPQSRSYGSFSADYKRTWWSRPDNAVPNLKGKQQ
jgi:hypothetical protein